MRRIIAICLVLCLCAAFCACHSENAQTTTAPQNEWDRTAEATKTMEKLYNCVTVEEYSAVCQSGTSNKTLETMAQSYADFKAMLKESNITGMYVRDIRFVETRDGYDIFLVAPGFMITENDEAKKMTVPPYTKTPLGMNTAVVGSVWDSSFTAMIIEDGHYVLANIPTEKWMPMIQRYTLCGCTMRPVAVFGDPCTTCSGTGSTTYQPELQEPQESPAVNHDCLTCGGRGLIEAETPPVDDSDDQTSVTLGLKDCPDCDKEWSIQFDGNMNADMGTLQPLPIPCPDCDGLGAPIVSSEACTDCGGKGYTIND